MDTIQRAHFCAGAYSRACAREIEENMGLTFAYMPLRTYTRLAEYGLQICVVQR